MTTDATTHTFDWHEEEAQNGRRGTFLSWAVLTMMPEHDERWRASFEELSDATDNFKRVELGITINGIEVDAEKFMARLDKAVEDSVEREAKKMLLARVPGLEAIAEAVADVEASVKEQILAAAHEAGFEVTEDDWRCR